MVVRLSVFKGFGVLSGWWKISCFYTGLPEVGAKLKKAGIRKRLRKITLLFRLDKNRQINQRQLIWPTNTSFPGG